MPPQEPAVVPPWLRLDARVVRKEDPLLSKYTVTSVPRKMLWTTTLRIRDEATGDLAEVSFEELMAHFARDERPEFRTCMALDKWGEFNCGRAKDHERNPGDPHARVHRAEFQHRVYEWKGRGASKEVQRRGFR